MQVNEKDLVQYTPHIFLHGLTTSVLGLRLTISSDHFSSDSSMKVRCVATAPLMWRGDRESILKKFDRREALLLGKYVIFNLLNILHWFSVTLSPVTKICWIFEKIWKICGKSFGELLSKGSMKEMWSNFGYSLSRQKIKLEGNLLKILMNFEEVLEKLISGFIINTFLR